MSHNLRSWAFTATEIAEIEARQKVIDDQNAKLAQWNAEEQRQRDLQRYSAEELALFDQEYADAKAQQEADDEASMEAERERRRDYEGDFFTSEDQRMLDESRGK